MEKGFKTWVCPVCGRENKSEWICPECGFDETKNYEKYYTAVRLPEQTRTEAKRKFAELCYRRGCAYRKEGNHVQAAAYYKKSAELGNAEAQNDLGICFLRGDGVPRDDTKAVEYFQKAAYQENPVAQFNMGVCFDTGYRGGSVQKDDKEAADWYDKSARRGYARAQNRLGIFYLEGRGVSRNYEAAVKWMQAAADNGCEIDRKKLEEAISSGAKKISGGMIKSDISLFNNVLGMRVPEGSKKIKRKEIVMITFSGRIEDAPDNAKDVSEKRDGSVLAWVDGSSGNYNLHLAGKGGIRANTNSAWMFGDYINLRKIIGMENLDTSQVTDMNHMFANCSKLQEIDVSGFDTGKVKNMSEMFSGCSALRQLDVSNFKISRETDKKTMFTGVKCEVKM